MIMRKYGVRYDEMSYQDLIKIAKVRSYKGLTKEKLIEQLRG